MQIDLQLLEHPTMIDAAMKESHIEGLSNEIAGMGVEMIADMTEVLIAVGNMTIVGAMTVVLVLIVVVVTKSQLMVEIEVVMVSPITANLGDTQAQPKFHMTIEIDMIEEMIEVLKTRVDMIVTIVEDIQRNEVYIQESEEVIQGIVVGIHLREVIKVSVVVHHLKEYVFSGKRVLVATELHAVIHMILLQVLLVIRCMALHQLQLADEEEGMIVMIFLIK
jgi:hypothetical protein